jgi:hypothetical protein
MVITLLAWIYISVVCWTFGYIICSLFERSKFSLTSLHFTVVCLIGFSFLTVLSSFLSLITGLQNLLFHISLLFSSAVFLIIIPKSALYSIKKDISWRAPLLYLCILAYIGVLLAMSIWHIKHPDTVEYHSAIIESIKSDKVPIGFAQENLRYGLQSNWFISCALFSFDFLGFNNLTFINSTILFWLLCFVGTQINKNSFEHLTEQNHFVSLLWITFLAIAFWDYTQMRLTATSASPDYPTTLFILLVCFLFGSYDLNKENILLLLFLISIAFTQKLSAFPLIIILFYLLFIVFKRKPFLTIPSLLIISIVTFPFLIRNYMTSGHIFYPSSFPNMFKPYWSIHNDEINFLQEYIKAYARVGSSNQPEVVLQVNRSPISIWIPQWWQLRSLAQKVMIISSSLILMFSIISIQINHIKLTVKQLILLSTCIIGLISWFLLAPDPRFGIAYFMLSASFLNKNNSKRLWVIKVNYRIIHLGLIILTLLLICYFGYRLLYFFDKANLLYPYSQASSYSS